MAEGKKSDSGKLPWHLLPLDAVSDVVEVLKNGAAKYGDRNWEQGMAHSRVFSAAMRHLVAHQAGDNLDPESGLPHLAHAACNILFLLAYQQRGVGEDDRAPVWARDSSDDHKFAEAEERGRKILDRVRLCTNCRYFPHSVSDKPCEQCTAFSLWEPRK